MPSMVANTHALRVFLTPAVLRISRPHA